MTIYKICRSCNERKAISDFYKHSGTKDGTLNICKACHYEKSKEYRDQHRERYNELARGYYKTNAKRIGEKRKEYNETHKKQQAESHKKWMRENRERMNEYARRNRWRYRARVNAYNRRRRKENPVWYYATRLQYPVRYVLNKNGKCVSKRAEAITGLSAKELFAHLKKTWEDNYAEPFCAQKCDIDHIVPISTAKTTDDVDKLFHYTNLRLLPQSENRGRTGK